jgi:hypothetical protein
MTLQPKLERWALSTFVIVFFALQAAISLRHNLNWDEYFFLSLVYSFVDGRLTDTFQTFHVHLLAWLTWLPASEAEQLVAGRTFMMLCEAGSLFCLYRVAREFVSAPNALFAVAAWCAVDHALVQGASFRADPLAGFLSMAALAVLMAARLGWKEAAAGGLLAAAGLLVTIKTVFFVPAFLGAFLWRWQRDESRAAVVRHFALAALLLLIAYAGLWTLHALSLAPPPHAAASPASATLQSENSALNKVILSQALFPRADYVVPWAVRSLLPLLLCALGLWHSARRKAGPAAARPFLPVLLLAAPILSLVIYRNAFPYFFPFIMLPAVLAAGLGAEAMTSRSLRLVVIAAMALPPLAVVPRAWTEDQSAQRMVAHAAHELFRSPVGYLDRSSMLPSFPHSGFFMSTWGIEGYLAGGKPRLAQAVVGDQPPLLILNSPLLRDAVAPRGGPLPWRLLPTDAEALRENYIEQWGPLWVAGKSLPAAGNFAIVIEGTYTLECRGRRQVDGADLPCGGTTKLSPGEHSWAGGAATLRWGDHLPVPAERVPTKPIFYGF